MLATKTLHDWQFTVDQLNRLVLRGRFGGELVTTSQVVSYKNLKVMTAIGSMYRLGKRCRDCWEYRLSLQHPEALECMKQLGIQ